MNYDASLKDGCILSAEDNDVNQMVLEHTLSEQDVPFLIVNNGKEAVEAWQQLSPRLILMDISMPVMNGLDAIKQIREYERAKARRVPIVALTAHALNGDRERMLEAGADYYVTKPINPTALLATIADILNNHQQNDAVA